MVFKFLSDSRVVYKVNDATGVDLYIFEDEIHGHSIEISYFNTVPVMRDLESFGQAH